MLSRREFLEVAIPLGWVPEAIKKKGVEDLSPAGRLSLTKDAVIASSLLLAACGSQQQQPIGSSVTPSTMQFIGEDWRDDEIYSLASSMVTDPRFPEIVKAGNILLGTKLISSESSLFSDKRINIKTVQGDHIKLSTGLQNGILASLIAENEPSVTVEAMLKSGGKRTIRAGSGFTLDSIVIPTRLMEQRKDLAFRIWVAKEIYNVTATDIVTQMVFEE